MANEPIVDQPEPIPDQALDSAAGGSVFNDAVAKAKALAEMMANIEKARSDIAMQTVRNVRG